MKIDPVIKKLVAAEKRRQKYGLELIPSENYASPEVLGLLSSVLGNKYSEGYPSRRYYGGNEIIDDIEKLAIERAMRLFKVPHANVQPYSGSPANFAVYMATCKPGDTVMGLNLTDGGHLTHGWKVSATGIFFNSIPYHVKKDGRIDFDEVEMLAIKHKPRLIWAGATAYVYKYDYKRFAEIADSVGAYLACDIAHVAGLIVGEVHPSPADYAHVITTTTHKTLRGPRGGIIMVTNKGLKKDPDLAKKIDRAIFPGLQGGPHDHQTASIAQALYEAAQPAFKKYATQIVANSKVLAESLIKHGLDLVGSGSENHMMLVDLTNTHGVGSGVFAEKALDLVGLTVNKNTIPGEQSSPFYPSGIRLGTPAATTRGLREKDMLFIADKIAEVLNETKKYVLPESKIKRQDYIQVCIKELIHNPVIKKIRKEVLSFLIPFRNI